MASLLHIFGEGGFVAADHDNVVIYDSPETQLSTAIQDAGYISPEYLKLDGKIHRFKSDAKDKGKSGWYVAYDGDYPAGAFGSYRDGESSINWSAKTSKTPSFEDLQAIATRRLEIAESRRKDIAASKEMSALSAAAIWDSCDEASPEHPYLVRKQIKPHGLRQTSDGRLVVPMYAGDELGGLQFIDADGSKRFHGSPSGKIFGIGDFSKKPTYMAEGMATAATVAQLTGRGCYVAFSASNMPAVAGVADIIIADNDAHCVGKKYADKCGKRVIMPPVVGMDINDYAIHHERLAIGLFDSRKITLTRIGDVCDNQQLPSWIVKKWLVADTVSMLVAAPASGKSVLAIDWAAHVAFGKPWHGNKVKKGSVIYIAGEGHAGIVRRFQAWAIDNMQSLNDADIYITNRSVKLQSSYSEIVECIQSVKAENPVLIIIDTLARAFDGDENSNKDMSAFIATCDNLRHDFTGAHVMAVHHSGHSATRARGGSSALGDVDSSFNLEKTDGGAVLTCTKQKDDTASGSIVFDLAVIPLGYKDEDDEDVTSVTFRLADDQSIGKVTKSSLSPIEFLGVKTFIESAEIEKDFLISYEEAWRAKFYDAMGPIKTIDSKKKSFQRVRESLHGKGRIMAENGNYVSRNDEDLGTFSKNSILP